MIKLPLQENRRINGRITVTPLLAFGLVKHKLGITEMAASNEMVMALISDTTRLHSRNGYRAGSQHFGYFVFGR
jgi:hypothetical protein